MSINDLVVEMTKVGLGFANMGIKELGVGWESSERELISSSAEFQNFGSGTRTIS